MGQPIPEEMRRKILEKEEVWAVTEQHVWLKDGHIYDPSEFVVEQKEVTCILKLLRCGCTGAAHGAGYHVWVKGIVKVYGTGNEVCENPVPSWCPCGVWQREEVVNRVDYAK